MKQIPFAIWADKISIWLSLTHLKTSNIFHNQRVGETLSKARLIILHLSFPPVQGAQIARGRSPSLRQEDRYLFKTSITLPSAGRAISVAN